MEIMENPCLKWMVWGYLYFYVYLHTALVHQIALSWSISLHMDPMIHDLRKLRGDPKGIEGEELGR